MSKITEETINFSRIPEACLSHVLSLTSPKDSCLSSAVSTVFKSAVESDTVWEKFLPSDYQEILNRTVEDIKFSSKRDLYFKLCSPVLIDGGKMSFQLEKSSGAKCFMISAKELFIVWPDGSFYWQWLPMSDIRFQEVAHLHFICWLEFSGKIESKMLTKKTTYGAYLVYKLNEKSRGLSYPPQETTIKVGMNESKRYVRLNPYKAGYNNVMRERIEELEEREASNKIPVPSTRNDGWLEIEMGKFYNENGDDGEIHICLLESRGGNGKHGLTVYGIEVRPKK